METPAHHLERFARVAVLADAMAASEWPGECRACGAMLCRVALFEPVFAALDAAGVRYVVVGGVAVVLQGHPRFTADLGLVVDLDPEPCRRAIDALVDLGLEPRAPVSAAELADPERRREWIEEMEVFSLYHPRDPLLTVDVFVRSPLPFAELWERSDVVTIDGIPVRVASIPHLVAMKQRVGRAVDREDVERLWRSVRPGRQAVATEGWEAATWDGARRAQLRDQARLSPEQRLRWLESAIRFGAAAATARREAGSAAPLDEESGGP